ncbi:MAG: hypothetical protein EBT47_05735 [Chloroflexi bacterium]|nr:hypothetical protein [Chloroflexota bacterium]
MITKRVTKGNIWGVVQSRLYVPISDLRRMFNLPTDDVRSATTRVPTPETPFEFRPTPPEFVSERPADITRLADMARVAEAEGHAPRGVRVAIPEEQTVAPSDDEASGGSGGDDGSRRRRRGGIGRSTRARSV